MNFRHFYDSIADLPKCHSVIEEELRLLSRRNAALWKIFGESLPLLAESLLDKLRKEFFYKKQLLFSTLTQTRTVQDDQHYKELEECLERVHKEDAELKFKQEHFKDSVRNSIPKVTDHLVGEDVTFVPIFYDDVVRIPKNSKAVNQFAVSELITENEVQESVAPEIKPEGSHLVVLCHGLQGNHTDMLQIMEKFRQYDQSTIFLTSKANENDHQGELYLMGRRLAEEILEHHKLLTTTTTTKISAISFVAFSTGSCIL